jgi:hypothetical protein
VANILQEEELNPDYTKTPTIEYDDLEIVDNYEGDFKAFDIISKNGVLPYSNAGTTITYNE